MVFKSIIGVTRYLVKLLAVFSLIGFLVSCGGGGDSVGGDDSVDVEVDDSNITLRYSIPNLQIGGTSDHLIAIATDTEVSESLSIIGEIDENGNPTSISALTFVAEDGSFTEIKIDDNGLPLTYNDGDGYTLEFSNYTSNSVDVSVYDQYEFLIEGPTTFDGTTDFISTVISNPLTLGAQVSSANINAVVSIDGAISKTLQVSSSKISAAVSIDGAISKTLQVAATLISGVGCYKNYATRLVLIKSRLQFAPSCASAILSAIGVLTDNTAAAFLAFELDAELCGVSRDFASCNAMAIATIAYGFDQNFYIRVPVWNKVRPGNGKVNLNWYSTPGADSYNIYSRLKGETEFKFIANTTNTYYPHTDLKNAYEYEYELEGVRSDVQYSKRSLIVSVKPYPTIPSIPRNISIKDITHNKATIKWERIPNADGYFVYHSKEPFKGLNEIGEPIGWPAQWLGGNNFDIPPTYATYKYLDSDTQYYFAVIAVVDGKDSELSNVFSARTLVSPPPLLPGPPTTSFDLVDYIDVQNNVRVNWYGYSSEATGYNLYWGTTTGQSPESYQKKLPIDNKLKFGHIFDKNEFIPGTEYFFTVTAVNESGEGPVSNEVSRIVASPSVIGPPTLLTPIPGDGEVTLAWDSVSGADRYDVYWGTTSGQSPSSHANWLYNPSSPVTIPSLINGTNYYFTATATIGDTESSPSTEKTAVPIVPPPPPIPDGVCVLDSETGLMWETKTNDGGLRDRSWTYMNTTNMNGIDPRINYDWGECASSSSDTDGIYCHTEGYVAAVNTAGLCGFNDWRMPTVAELESLIEANVNSPYIDMNLFPNTQDWYYWSSTRFDDEASLYVQYYVYGGFTFALDHQNSSSVRLVRDGL